MGCKIETKDPVGVHTYGRERSTRGHNSLAVSNCTSHSQVEQSQIPAVPLPALGTLKGERATRLFPCSLVRSGSPPALLCPGRRRLAGGHIMNGVGGLSYLLLAPNSTAKQEPETPLTYCLLSACSMLLERRDNWTKPFRNDLQTLPSILLE